MSAHPPTMSTSFLHRWILDKECRDPGTAKEGLIRGQSPQYPNSDTDYRITPNTRWDGASTDR